MAHRIDLDAARRGAVVTSLTVIPLAFVAGRLIPDDSALQIPVTLAIFAGFVAGGYVAGRATSGSAPITGTLASLPCLVLVTVAYVIIQLRSDQPIYLALIAGQFIVGTTLGMLGGKLGGRSTDENEPLVRS